MHESVDRVRPNRRVRPFLWLAIVTIAAGLLCGRFEEHTLTASPTVAEQSANAAAGEAAIGRVEPAPAGAIVKRFVRAGTAVEMTLVPAGPAANRPAGALRAGDLVTVRLRITDAATGAPITGAKPAAWLTARVENEPRDPASLARKIGALLQGSPLVTAELDLNQFYVLALNTDATITVVDPRFGFGGTKLLALLPLPARGADWVLSADGNRLFVSIPSANQIAVIDTANWRLIGAVTGVDRPTRLVLERDGRHAWATTDTGVAVIDTESISLSARFETAIGAHDVALSSDDQHAFVSNKSAGTVSVIDARRFVKECDVAAGAAPGAVRFSAASQAAYVLDEADGTIAVVAGDPPSLVRRIAAGAGATTLAFAPGGRLGFVANPARREVAVFDTAADRVVRRVAADAEPDQIAFTDGAAYIRQAGSAMVRLVPLADLARPNGPTSVIDVPAGRNPLDRTSPDCLAPAIAPAVGDDAVLIANPADQTLYYYKEGLSAPMGSFRNYGHEPCAVLALDRSLRTAGPGIYETITRLRRPGRFDLAVFLDSPRLIHCFELEIDADPTKSAPRPLVRASAIPGDALAVAGRPQTFSFRLAEEGSGLAVAGKTDVRVLATLPARWQQAFSARPAADNDRTYAIEFTPPHAGLYCFYVACPSAGLALHNPRMLYLQVKGSGK